MQSFKAAGKFRPERKGEFGVSSDCTVLAFLYRDIRLNSQHHEISRSFDTPLHSFALLVMASIARSRAFGQALRPITSQPTSLHTSKLSQLMPRRSRSLQFIRIAGLHSTARKAAFLPTLPRQCIMVAR
jgi:hypothetical protein